MDEPYSHDDPYRIERPELPETNAAACFYCGYDLSATARDAVCPECGTPTEFGYGHGPLSSVETETLQTIARGFGNAMAGILLYVGSTLVNIFVSMYLGISTFQQIQPGQQPTFGRMYYLVNFASGLLTTLASLIFFAGWWKITSPLDGLPDSLDRSDWRRILRITIPIQVAGLFLGLVFHVYWFAMMPIPSPTGSQQSLQGWEFVLTVLSALIGLVLFANMIVIWIFQMFYARWFARLALDTPMAKRAKHLIWSGPLMVVVGSMCLMIGPLVFAILYYLMHRNLRRDVQAILDERPMAAPQTM